MSPTLDGDIAQHTIILTLGYTAHELCRAEQDSFRHQCVLLPHWTGPDRMYHFGDDWYTGGAPALPSACQGPLLQLDQVGKCMEMRQVCLLCACAVARRLS